jgi:uroporphyrinogen decarboxylase
MPAFTAAHADDVRCEGIPFSLFERPWSMGGMADLMVDMLDAPEFVDELFDAISDFNCAILDEVLRFDIDCVKFGDDWGQQTGLIFGARLWCRFIETVREGDV